MGGRLARFRKLAALADEPTPARRLLAATIAGSIAFLLVQLFFRAALDAGSAASLFSSVAFAVAAAFAAATMRRGVAVAYGLLAVIWLLLEGLAAVFAVAVAGLG